MNDQAHAPEPYGFDVSQRRPGFWTRALQVLSVLVVLAALAGMVQGASYTSSANATGTNFFGRAAVQAQLQAAGDIRQCGTQTGDIKAFAAVSPPFTASNVVPGPAMRASGAQATALVTCLTKLYEPLGYAVSKCPVAATSVGITAGRLGPYITAEVMCRSANGGQ